MYAFAKDGEVLFLCTLCMQFSLLSSIAILAIYRFDAMFDTESGLPEKCKYSFAQLWLRLSILGNFAK